MSEPSNVPPLWSIEFLSHVTQGFISPDSNEEWTITFRQPASDYLNFRQKLDSQNVSLENVIIKENDAMVVGTVKVKNISFQKEVIVRSSWDNWKTEQDTFCTYSPVSITNWKQISEIASDVRYWFVLLVFFCPRRLAVVAVHTSYTIRFRSNTRCRQHRTKLNFAFAFAQTEKNSGTTMT